ncbi:DUF2946 domain-containing protein [Metapseudomonas lalkuanensis]|uniref:DUF2946 domain-containing protein n=1 Tax=Metapseudomonas lalkuanensis TaxID=2604832 RepID=A0A5J6QMV1_9GAMM|nr:DUF2946 domain-containing protein [Pseudomonas lalkuanensis]QEY62621.1 DUF2946 domain-containing protein [Pseudomonas lalkuanensis]UCO96156.1 DUF2946 domain-containing protein [Pseudomonas lalkuanensis]
MKFARQDRLLIAWMLYACVLLNLFACGLHHGQATGLELSGLGGSFCSGDSASGPALDGDLGGSAAIGWSGLFKCPLCTGIILGAVAVVLLSWLLGAGRAPFLPRAGGDQHPPRHAWPSANPRASPLA